MKLQLSYEIMMKFIRHDRQDCHWKFHRPHRPHRLTYLRPLHGRWGLLITHRPAAAARCS